MLIRGFGGGESSLRVYILFNCISDDVELISNLEYNAIIIRLIHS